MENIKQFYMDCKDEVKKYDVLVQLYHILTIGQSIIFCEVYFSSQRTHLHFCYFRRTNHLLPARTL